uniref:PCFS4-like zinc finger domain-containing protein n=1 Tax=Romanomermis culicivorax TaxID=13658 RepID=A0A915KL92_ROMCU
NTHIFAFLFNFIINTCAVCFERFEQFWDEEEETWKLRNAVLVDDTAYHPLCYEDTLNISNINDHSTETFETFILCMFFQFFGYLATVNYSNFFEIMITIMETKKKKKIQTSDGKLESKQQISDQDLELEKLARDQLLREAKRGAVRAQTMGSQG